ncbi:MAG: hypothetical protein V9G98_03090 [Candidatus Competibacter sp.]
MRNFTSKRCESRRAGVSITSKRWLFGKAKRSRNAPGSISKRNDWNRSRATCTAPAKRSAPKRIRALFLGRDDLRDRLAREILTAPNLPLLLIQGQRRVGKTSLLNFLPSLLGASFKVVYQDLQDARVASVPAWLEDLRRRVADVLGWSEAPEPTPTDDWVSAWRWFENAFAGVLQQRDFKLILALDEYEVLHGYLRQEPCRRRAPARRHSQFLAAPKSGGVAVCRRRATLRTGRPRLEPLFRANAALSG